MINTQSALPPPPPPPEVCELVAELDGGGGVVGGSLAVTMIVTVRLLLFGVESLNAVNVMVLENLPGAVPIATKLIGVP
jgi:hypothetical protein